MAFAALVVSILALAVAILWPLQQMTIQTRINAYLGLQAWGSRLSGIDFMSKHEGIFTGYEEIPGEVVAAINTTASLEVKDALRVLRQRLEYANQIVGEEKASDETEYLRRRELVGSVSAAYGGLLSAAAMEFGGPALSPRVIWRHVRAGRSR